MAATGQLKDRSKVINSLFPSTISSVFQCRAGRSFRAAGELGWEQPGLPILILQELLGAQPALLLQSWDQAKPSPALEHLPAAGNTAQELQQATATNSSICIAHQERSLFLSAQWGWNYPELI